MEFEDLARGAKVDRHQSNLMPNLLIPWLNLLTQCPSIKDTIWRNKSPVHMNIQYHLHHKQHTIRLFMEWPLLTRNRWKCGTSLLMAIRVIRRNFIVGTMTTGLLLLPIVRAIIIKLLWTRCWPLTFGWNV